MEYCWLFRFSACDSTTKSAGFWVAVEYEYLGREASLKKSPIGKISFDKS